MNVPVEFDSMRSTCDASSVEYGRKRVNPNYYVSDGLPSCGELHAMETLPPYSEGYQSSGVKEEGRCEQSELVGEGVEGGLDGSYKSGMSSTPYYRVDHQRKRQALSTAAHNTECTGGSSLGIENGGGPPTNNAGDRRNEFKNDGSNHRWFPVGEHINRSNFNDEVTTINNSKKQTNNFGYTKRMEDGYPTRGDAIMQTSNKIETKTSDADNTTAASANSGYTQPVHTNDSSIESSPVLNEGDASEMLSTFSSEEQSTEHTSGGRRNNSKNQTFSRLPITNISRIMKRTLPDTAKVTKESKEMIQEGVTEFIKHVSTEAGGHCSKEKRKIINGDDVIWAMKENGFGKYADYLMKFLNRLRESSATHVSRSGEASRSTADERDMEQMQSGNLPSMSSNLPFQASGFPQPYGIENYTSGSPSMQYARYSGEPYQYIYDPRLVNMNAANPQDNFTMLQALQQRQNMQLMKPPVTPMQARLYSPYFPQLHSQSQPLQSHAQQQHPPSSSSPHGSPHSQQSPQQSHTMHATHPHHTTTNMNLEALGFHPLHTRISSPSHPTPDTSQYITSPARYVSSSSEMSHRMSPSRPLHHPYPPPSQSAFPPNGSAFPNSMYHPPYAVTSPTHLHLCNVPNSSLSPSIAAEPHIEEVGSLLSSASPQTQSINKAVATQPNWNKEGNTHKTGVTQGSDCDSPT